MKRNNWNKNLVTNEYTTEIKYSDGSKNRVYWANSNQPTALESNQASYRFLRISVLFCTLRDNCRTIIAALDTDVLASGFVRRNSSSPPVELIEALRHGGLLSTL